MIRILYMPTSPFPYCSLKAHPSRDTSMLASPTSLHGNILGIPISDLADLKICLCLSALPLILDVDVQLKVLTVKYGPSLVNAVITALVCIPSFMRVRPAHNLGLKINTSPNNRRCTYPDHATQCCSDSDPCDFTCDSPYVKEGDECVCAPPNTMCNGVCGDFSSVCLPVNYN